MHRFQPLPILAALVSLGACAASPASQPVPAYDAAALAGMRFRTVLIAGDASLPVFDNATEAIATTLRERHGTAGDIQRLQESFPASHPQFWLGPAVAGLGFGGA